MKLMRTLRAMSTLKPNPRVRAMNLMKLNGALRAIEQMKPRK